VSNLEAYSHWERGILGRGRGHKGGGCFLFVSFRDGLLKRDFEEKKIRRQEALFAQVTGLRDGGKQATFFYEVAVAAFLFLVLFSDVPVQVTH
jgi:hypothetical protein